MSTESLAGVPIIVRQTWFGKQTVAFDGATVSRKWSGPFGASHQFTIGEGDGREHWALRFLDYTGFDATYIVWRGGEVVSTTGPGPSLWHLYGRFVLGFLIVRVWADVRGWDAPATFEAKIFATTVVLALLFAVAWWLTRAYRRRWSTRP